MAQYCTTFLAGWREGPTTALVQKTATLPLCWPEAGRTKETVKETNLHLGQRLTRENAIWPSRLSEPQLFARSRNRNWFHERQQ